MYNFENLDGRVNAQTLSLVQSATLATTSQQDRDQLTILDRRDEDIFCFFQNIKDDERKFLNFSIGLNPDNLSDAFTTLETELDIDLRKDLMNRTTTQHFLSSCGPHRHNTSQDCRPRKQKSSPYMIPVSLPLPDGMEESQPSRPMSRSLSRTSIQCEKGPLAKGKEHSMFTSAEIVSWSESTDGNTTAIFIHASTDSEDKEPFSYIMTQGKVPGGRKISVDLCYKKVEDSHLSKFKPCSICSTCHNTDGHIGDCLQFDISSSFKHSGTQVILPDDDFHNQKGKDTIWKDFENFLREKTNRGATLVGQTRRYLSSIAADTHNISFPFPFDENWMFNICKASEDSDYIVHITRFTSYSRTIRNCNTPCAMVFPDKEFKKGFETNGTIMAFLNSIDTPDGCLRSEDLIEKWKDMWPQFYGQRIIQ